MKNIRKIFVWGGANKAPRVLIEILREGWKENFVPF